MTTSTTTAATSPTQTGTETSLDRGWNVAEEHILEQIGSLTIWEAERWAAAYEHRLPKISLMANRVSYLQAAGGGSELDYLLGAFARIDSAVMESSWARPFCEAMAKRERVGDRTLAVTETMAAVNAVARYAITAVVLTDEFEGIGSPAPR